MRSNLFSPFQLSCFSFSFDTTEPNKFCDPWFGNCGLFLFKKIQPRVSSEKRESFRENFVVFCISFASENFREILLSPALLKNKFENFANKNVKIARKNKCENFAEKMRKFGEKNFLY